MPSVSYASDTVVLIHGLNRSSLAMARLAYELRNEGYTVRNLDYPSRAHDIRTLAETTLGLVFTGTDSAEAGRIHLVTHSMGGIWCANTCMIMGGRPRLAGWSCSLRPTRAANSSTASAGCGYIAG